MNNKPVSYLQTDAKWSKVLYANKGETTTIGHSGCGPTSMAMVIATWCDPKITPVETCAWAQSHGYKATANGTYQSYIVAHAKAYGLEATRLNKEALQYYSQADKNKFHQQAHDYIDDGYLVVCLMGKGNWTTGGHYILWYSNDGADVLINDPASTKATRVRNTFELLKSQCRVYWAIKPPEEVISLTNSEVKAYIDQAVKNAAVNESQVEAIVRKVTYPTGKVPSSWAAKEWYSMCKSKIMDGSAPLGNMTREQVAAVLVRLGLVPTVEMPEGFNFETDKV